ncbi:MAG: dual specificity protein phosphatase family protein [Anaerolineaceae bacterium]|nr:dual specificity protein phosphatase family protein [Anaerolineaceae bacterium]
MIKIRDWLYIGKYRETQDKELLDSRGITALLHLAAPVQQPGIEVLYLPVDDGVSIQHKYIEQGVAFVRAQKVAERTVLIACGAGISRSTVFAIAVLHEEEGLSLLDAYRSILEVHRDAMPHYMLWDSLREYYQSPITYLDMWRQVHGQKWQE